jgi:NAD(P)-dependent dehydrogenase (short-subunit alcohol dehydrogenase family)
MNEYRRPSTYQRVWLITGSSTGLGRAVADAVLARGQQAVVTAQAPERVRDIIERYPAQALVVELDITRREQVRSVVRRAIERFGHVDVVLNNEGFSEALAQEVAPLGIKVITIERGSVNGHHASDAAAAAEAIIAAVDTDAAETRNREQAPEVK